MLRYWSYAWKHYIYIYIYLSYLHWKPGILDARLIFFYNIKKYRPWNKYALKTGYSRYVIKMQSEENAWKLTWCWNGQRWWCCSFLRTTGHHWFWRQRRTLVTSVGLCLSLLADAFSAEDEDDDEGVICRQNGCSSLCVFLLFLCFPGGCCFG